MDPSDVLSCDQRDADDGFVLPCTAHPRSELIVETHREEETRAHRRAHRLPVPRG